MKSMPPSAVSPEYTIREDDLAEESSAARLDGIDLSSSQGAALEAGGESRGIEQDTLGGLNAAERSTASTANAAAGTDCLLERTMLLGVVAVGAEGSVGRGSRAVSVAGPGLGELAEGRGGMRLGSVVDVGRNASGTDKLDEGSSLGVDSSLSKDSGSSEHFDCGVWCFVEMDGWCRVIRER